MSGMLKKIPFYVLLLPVFFVIHGCLEYYGYISFSDALLLTVTYCAGAGLLFGLFFLFWRSERGSELVHQVSFAIFI